jgi:hypothetical protein
VCVLMGFDWLTIIRFIERGIQQITVTTLGKRNCLHLVEL